MEKILIEGAREHNLKNVTISIPKNKLVVLTGISGSGKSSLAFDTIFAEGQRRYLESFGTFARQFMGELKRPDVEHISGLSPVISIEQKTTNKNPRSTVGTVTEVYDFLRLLFARVAHAYSYNTGKRMQKYSVDEIIRLLREQLAGHKINILAPVVKGRKGHYRELFDKLLKQGFVRVRVDGDLKELVPKMQVDRFKIHDIEVVIDRLSVKKDIDVRLNQSVAQALKKGDGVLMIEDIDTGDILQFSQHLMCIDTGISYEDPNPNTFSFNSPYGYCPECKGFGVRNRIDIEKVIPDLNLSPKKGAIIPVGEDTSSWYYKQMEQIAKKHKIDLSKPLSTYSNEQLNWLLYGNAEGIIYEPSEGVEAGQLEGILNLINRWYHETTSDAIREWAERFMSIETCPSCQGQRLKKNALWFKIDQKNISELSAMSLVDLGVWFSDIESRLDDRQNAIATELLKEIRSRIHFLLDVGLHYLTLDRPTRTLSGGESQRIRLATQIGSQLTGITYILDEPSIGLHQRDNERLIQSLKKLRDMHNTVLVVEHDRDMMMAADWLIDIGPMAGHRGGQIVSSNTPEDTLKANTLTAQYLKREQDIWLPKHRRTGNGHVIKLSGASGHNLKNVSVAFPLGTLTVVTGVSGSGKSTLINETLYPILAKHCYPHYKGTPMPYKSIEGLEHIDKVIDIDQTPIGRTPRSNPATYSNVFTDIRMLFAQVPEAKIRGYKPGRFSFNVKGGRCEVCQGAGLRTIEMNFLPDIYVPCETCQGKRYNRETLEIRYKGMSISDVLDLTIDEALEVFNAVPFIYRKLKSIQDVGLGYISLGQNAVTLSGGEAQRLKLATELAKKDTGQTVYILDEPSTGLHFEDIKILLLVLQKIVDRGNTVIVIEHNLDIIKVADHVIDIGPEGGAGGGKIVGQGTPETLAKIKKSYTGQFLSNELKFSKKELKYKKI